MLILDRVLMQKVVVSIVPKKELMKVLPYLGKFSLQIRTRIYCVMKNKLPHSNFQIVFQSKCKLINFFTFKVKFIFSYVLALLINLSVVALMLPVMAKLSAILKLECVNTLEFLLLLEIEWKGQWFCHKKASFFSIHSSGFDDFSILASNNNDFKVTLMKSLKRR